MFPYLLQIAATSIAQDMMMYMKILLESIGLKLARPMVLQLDIQRAVD